PCGETHLRAFWEGRRADVVAVADKELVPNDVHFALIDMKDVSEPVLEFQIVRGRDASRLRVRVEAAAPSDALRERVRARLGERLGVVVSLELVAAGSLPRPFYKPLRVVED
ncbi:MAG: hypothetical protein LC663_01175, partial [Actinobacteria bacterium]|nr:hypothetical protein [Actinomycetota bacterium]